MSLILDEHRQYLSDPARLGAYARAIGEVVRPGAVVVDLGSGSGIFSLLACRAGAARVYAIEHGDVIGVARAIVRANGYADRVTFVAGHSTRVTLGERADVVVCDQIGHFGFEAGAIAYLRDAHERFLRPGGVTIPSSVDLWVAPVEAPEMAARVEFWRSQPLGFDMSPVRALAVNTGYPTHFDAAQFLAPAATGVRLACGAGSAAHATLDVSMTIARAGTLQGIGGGFTAQLSPGVVMTNSPESPARVQRRNVFFPLDRAVEVAPGDHVRVRVGVRPDDVVVSWVVEVHMGPAIERFAHSTLRGMLLTDAVLARTRADYVPKLTHLGAARQSVLALCDGTRSLSDLEAELYRRHGDLFHSAEDAAAFAAEVITVYTE